VTYIDQHFAKFPPVIILAAPRSGTKLLRSILANSTELSGPDYDINYIWMYGAYGAESDHRALEAANSRIKSQIRHYLFRAASGRRLLEKTVSNGLRVDFVSAVIPEARFIHLVRDGRDVVGSLLELWQLPASSTRNQSRMAMLRKLYEFPWLKSTPYLMRTIEENLLYKLGIRDIPPIWGPRYAGIEKDLAERSLAEVCARQWIECERPIPPALLSRPHINIRYEDLISDPSSTIETVGNWLCLPDVERLVDYAKKRVKPQIRSNWLELLSAEDQAFITSMLKPFLKQKGYAV
jgi:hypothetical protein